MYWDGDLGSIDLNIGSIAYLAVWDCWDGAAVGTPIFFSHYFNLTAATTSKASVSTATGTRETRSPTTDPSTSATTSFITNNPSSAAQTTSPIASDNSHSSNDTAVLAGGIGGGIGGAIVLVAAAVASWKLRRRRGTQEIQEDRSYFPPTRPNALYVAGAGVPHFPSPPLGQAKAYPQPAYPQPACFMPYNSNTPIEMSSQRSPIELPAESIRLSTHRFNMV